MNAELYIIYYLDWLTKTSRQFNLKISLKI